VAGTDPTISAASFTLAAGEWKDFEIRVPTAVMAREVIYLELDPSQAGVVELRNASYWHVIASSATSDRFVSGTLTGVPQPPRVAAVEGEAGILPQAVVESRACLGPCVIFEPTAATYYARVVNDTAASLGAELYLYGYDMQDDTEPQNDLRSTAPVLQASNAGAFEVLGDTDFWLAPGHIQATLSTVSGGVAINATVVDGGGLVVAGPYASGASFEVYAGESMRVRAATGTAAAPAKSTYFIETSALPGNPTRPPNYLEVTATNSESPLDQRSVPAGGMIEYRLSIPATVRSRDVLYVEVDAALGLELRSSSNLSTIASSSSSQSFSSGDSFLGAAGSAAGGAAATGSQAIAANKDCLGPCVIVVPPSNTLFIRVYGGSSNTNFSLYAYGSSLMDTTEPANDQTGSAPVLVGDVSGAIETIGDVDVWRMATTGTVAFDTVSGGIAMQARVLDVNGSPVPGNQGGGPFANGQSFGVFAGEYVRVSATDGNRAAVAAASTYFLERTGGLAAASRGRRAVQ